MDTSISFALTYLDELVAGNYEYQCLCFGTTLYDESKACTGLFTLTRCEFSTPTLDDMFFSMAQG